MASNTNTFVRLYRQRLDPGAKPGEAYGYWFILLGTIVALGGVTVFLLGSSYPRGDASYWTYRQVGIVLAAGGLPVVMLGMAFRLSLHPAAAAVGSLGVVLCAVAITWFVVLYPSNWTFAGPRPVLTTYMAGIGLLAAGITVVPLATPRLAVDRNQWELRQPYYELRRVDTGWQWQLFGSDDVALAESDTVFPDRSAARAALDELAAAAPVAGAEVSIKQEG